MRRSTRRRIFAALVLATALTFIGGTGDALAAGAGAIQPNTAPTGDPPQKSVPRVHGKVRGPAPARTKAPHPALVASRAVRAA
jgi:hypothetical protein